LVKDGLLGELIGYRLELRDTVGAKGIQQYSARATGSLAELTSSLLGLRDQMGAEGYTARATGSGAELTSSLLELRDPMGADG
jgi:hypothetical protein